MDVDNVVFVDSLSDADESDDDDDDERLIFIPDIEKRMTKIPEHVLRAPGTVAAGGAGAGAGSAVNRTSTDLVLYSVPKSLTVEEGGIDGVRKAIIESRARLRCKREAEEAAAAEAERARSAEMDGLQRMGGMGGVHVLGGPPLMNGDRKSVV